MSSGAYACFWQQSGNVRTHHPTKARRDVVSPTKHHPPCCVCIGLSLNNVSVPMEHATAAGVRWGEQGHTGETSHCTSTRADKKAYQGDSFTLVLVTTRYQGTGTAFARKKECCVGSRGREGGGVRRAWEASTNAHGARPPEHVRWQRDRARSLYDTCTQHTATLVGAEASGCARGR